MRIGSIGVLVGCVLTTGCGGGSSDERAPLTQSVTQNLTADSLSGKCLHMARHHWVSFATGTYTGDYDVRGREPNTPDGDESQVWCFDDVAGQPNTYRIMDLLAGRYLDAHHTSGNNYRVVLRTLEESNRQHWVASSSSGWFRFRQVSTGRYLDSYFGSNDEQFVTRTSQNDWTQHFYLFGSNDRAPQVDSCLPWYQMSSSDSCSYYVNCLVPMEEFATVCAAAGNEWSCKCYSSDGQIGTITQTGTYPPCDDALAACLAQ
jgi:hypothetical protein